MNRVLFFSIFLPVYAVVVGVMSYFAVEPALAAVNVSKHPNPFQAQSAITQTWHNCTGCYEDALDMQDPNNDCWDYSPGACNQVRFWYQGQNQYAADYAITQYGGSCTGRTVTIRYYDGVRKPLVRLHYVHLKSMTSLTTGSLGYAEHFSLIVGSTHDDEPCAAWSNPHLHYARSTDYGS